MSQDGPITSAKLWTVLAKSHRAIALFVEHSISQYELCLSDFMALEALLHKGPLGVSQIGAKILLASGSITAAVDRLEQKGLVRRELTGKDRRARIVHLTPAGRKLVTQIFKAHSSDLDRLSAGLTEEERATLYSGLKKLGFAAAAAIEQRTGINE